MYIPVAIVPFAQEFYCVINIQLVKENVLFTGHIHRLGVKVFTDLLRPLDM